MRKVGLGLLIVFAIIGLVATTFAGLLALRTTRVSAAGLLRGFGWNNMHMMNWWNQGNSGQIGCTDEPGEGRYGMMGGYGQGMMQGYRGGMMGGFRTGRGYSEGIGNCPYAGTVPSKSESGTRLSIEQALENAQATIADDENLTVVEVMEFQENFYAVVLEENTGKGAMELLVDPYSGNVYPEQGPNMMWNEKYGHMGRWFGGDSQLSISDAEGIAQEWLDKELPGAKIEGMGIDFYGYFSFDYEVNGQTAGMLSVNASSGDVWLHTWHGAFIEEIELDE